jgi:ribosomal protein L11 methylase PrmA
MEKGANRRKVSTIFDFPEGKSDAKKFVQLNYEMALKKMKQMSAKTVLIVLRDADMDEYNEVLSSFGDSVSNVFITIPKRNIETWFYFFANKNAESQDETINRKDWYKNNNEKPKPVHCGKQLVDLINNYKSGQSIPHIPVSLDATVSRIIKYEEKSLNAG